MSTAPENEADDTEHARRVLARPHRGLYRRLSRSGRARDQVRELSRAVSMGKVDKWRRGRDAALLQQRKQQPIPPRPDDPGVSVPPNRRARRAAQRGTRKSGQQGA